METIGKQEVWSFITIRRNQNRCGTSVLRAGPATKWPHFWIWQWRWLSCRSEIVNTSYCLEGSKWISRTKKKGTTLRPGIFLVEWVWSWFCREHIALYWGTPSELQQLLHATDSI